MEERALLGSDVDERGLDAGKHGIDTTIVDVTHHAAGVRTINQ